MYIILHVDIIIFKTVVRANFLIMYGKTGSGQ